MKGLFSPRQRVAILGLCLALGNLGAADLKEARVTAVVKDVKLLPGQAEPKSAAVNDTVTNDTAVRTGVDSRSELTFSDLTIARLGANTIFSFDKGTRTVELGGGAILLRVPKNSGGAKISTAAVTAAITGTTMMAEYHKGSSFKFIMLEGTAQICRPRDEPGSTRHDENVAPAQCVDLGPGQMLQGVPGRVLGKAVDVDIKKIVKSSQLIKGFGSLGSENLIGEVILAQMDRPRIDLLEQTWHDVVDQKTATEATPTPTPVETPTPTPTPEPTPTPSKYGALNTITSSNLSTIDSGTQINTDPSITRNGETDYGKIYRGPEQDGPPWAFFFGSISAFDTTAGLDEQFFHDGDLPIATFKFLSLILAGDPTISTANGGALNLALIAVGNITSAAPGGHMDFVGINKLMLGTQNGSITLGPELIFSGLEGFLLYARGIGSNVTLGSSFDVGDLNLSAEGSIQVNGSGFANHFHAFAGTDFLGGSGTITTGRIDITALRDINFNSRQFSAGDFHNIDVTLNAANVLNIDPTDGDRSVFTEAGVFSAYGRTINLLAGAEPVLIQFNPAATLTSFHAGTGGIHGPNVGFEATNLQLFSAGDIYIYGTHVIPDVPGETGATGTINAAGLFNAQSDVNTGDLTAGSSIYVGGNLFGRNLTAGTTIYVAGSLSGFGTAIAGDITASAGLDVDVTDQVDLLTDASGLTSGGNILIHAGRNLSVGQRLSAESFVGLDAGSGANITLTSGGSMSAADFILQTGVSEGVSLQNGANVTVDAGGDIMVNGMGEGEFFAAVANLNGHISNGGNILLRSTGGSILGATDYDLTVLNTAFDTIETGGNITVDAHTDFKTAQNGLNGSMNFDIQNRSGEIGTGGNISVTVGSTLAARDLFAEIDSSDGGSILNGGTITFQIGSLMQIQNSASFVIKQDPLLFRNPNGAIAVDLIKIHADSIAILGDRFDAYVDDSGGSGLPSGFFTANVTANEINVAGVLNVLGTVHADGSIVANTLSSTDVSASGIGSCIRVGSGGIQRFAVPGAFLSDLPHFISAPQVSSTGGINFDGEAGIGFAQGRAGGNLTINTGSITFGAGDTLHTNRPITNGPVTVGGDVISGSVTFNGGAGGGFDQFENEFGGGNGGTFTVNSDGDITVNSPIEATTGFQPQFFAPSGNGGTVNLNSTSGTVSIDNRIEVSSNDAAADTATPPPRRRSARGGNITVKSGKAGDAQNRAVAINITSSAQLLSLLAAAPTPRPGGKVTILATGANSDVNITGARIQADGGTIDIRHTGDGGRVNIAGIAPGFPATLSADVIKAGAFGANGSLSIGNSTLNANTLIRLYAPSSNGELIFIANTTLSSGSRIDLAASTITVNPHVVVTISGNAGPANIYTNNPNYAGPGGNNPNNGTFGGNGAHNPLPLSSAPAFDSAPPRPSGSSGPGAGSRAGSGAGGR